jgi:predicted ATP pyrophosphatase (TIGR00289 family)
MYRSLDPGLARISAQSLAIPQIELFVNGKDEVSPLIETLAGLDIDGLCDGAIASNYRRNRLAEVCRKLDIQLVLPLWHKDPAEILANMVDEGFKITIVELKSDRFDDSWVGRVFDQENLEGFLQACEKNGIDPMGESGEFKTHVLSGPDMFRRPGRRGSR